MKEIPINGGAVNAHQLFYAQLGERFVNFKLNYLTASAQWSLDVLEDDELLAAGLMLEPNALLLENNNIDIGSLIFVGDEPTLDNLGVSNSLVWLSNEEL